MSRSKPSWLATVLGDAYTLHFWPPYGDPEVQQAGHYTGWAQEGRLRQRLVDHVLGRGARLTQVQREAGGTWVVANVERGVTRDRETQLKERGASRRCSVCKASRDIEAGRVGKDEALAKWPNASPAERSILREIFGLEPEPAKAPEPVKQFIPAPAFREATPAQLDEIDALIDGLVACWKAEAASPEAAEAEPELEAG
jgi:predicted GIY-YIG superfamily endonuclease